MRNSWKGLVVGGLTGAFVGIALDLFASAVEQATRGAEHARNRVPDATDWLQGVTEKAAEWAHDTDVPERVREVAHRILGSEAINSGHVVASKVVEASKNKVHSTVNHSS
jgi:hypothetical protein